VLSIHCGSGVGFATVVDAADEGPGNASRGAKLHAMATEGKILNFNVILLPFPHCSRQGEHLHVLKPQIWLLSPGAGREWTGADDQAPETPLHFLPGLNAY